MSIRKEVTEMQLSLNVSFVLKDKGKVIQEGDAQFTTIAAPIDVCMRIADIEKFTDDAGTLRKLREKGEYVTVRFPKVS
ncbi:MAG: hypothetical protein NC078_11360 [Ruminococcus sp.]|nr:hypothetical protein [Ruminococcus sp.]